MHSKLNRASKALSNGEPARAKRLLEQILRSEPENVEALWMIARLLERRGEIDSWLETLEKLCKLLPQELYVTDELARAYAKTSQLDKAITLYREFLEKNPESENALYNLANFLGRKGEHFEAIDIFSSLLGRDIDHAEEVHLNLSNLYSEGPKLYSKSKKHLDQALVIDPHYEPAWFNLGNLNEQLGDLSEAKKCFEKVISIGDKGGGALARLADLTRFDEEDASALIEKMERNLHLKESPNPDLMFSLGRAYEQVGEYDKSFYMFESANSIDRHFLPDYLPEAMEDLFKRITDAYRRKPIASSGESDVGKVFICGNFRSGSTLLEQMLASHSSFSAGGERRFFRKISRDPRVNFPSGSPLEADLAIEIANEYNKETLDLFASDTRVTDKRPDNLLLVGLIKEVFPNAKIVVTLRDELDLAWSIFTTRFGPEVPYASSLKHTHHFIKLQRELVNHWQNVFEGDVLCVTYEDLIAEPKAELTQLLKELGEEWEDACLDFKELKNFVHTASSAQVRYALNKKSMGRAKPFKRHIDRVQ